MKVKAMSLFVSLVWSANVQLWSLERVNDQLLTAILTNDQSECVLGKLDQSGTVQARLFWTWGTQANPKEKHDGDSLIVSKRYFLAVTVGDYDPLQAVYSLGEFGDFIKAETISSDWKKGILRFRATFTKQTNCQTCDLSQVTSVYEVSPNGVKQISK